MTLVHTGFIPLPPGQQPGFDHADVYRDAAGNGRLYVAHTGANRIDVIDCATNTYVRTLPDHPGVAGVLIDSTHDLLFTSDRAAAQVSVYRCSDETLLGRVAVGEHPNGLAYDPTRRRLFVFNLGNPPGEHCTVSIVAIEQMATLTTNPLPGRPRWAVYDTATDSVYANIRDPAQIVVLNAQNLTIQRTISVPVAGPHGLALAGDHLWCAADGAALVILHRDTGAVLDTIALLGEPDVVMYDATLAHLYVAIGEPGVVCVVDTTRRELVETIPTERGAHTIGWNAAGRTLYVFQPKRSGVSVFVEAL